MKKPTIKQNPENIVPAEVLAESIVATAQGIRALRRGRMTDRALLVLIQDAAPSDAKLTQKHIKTVFAAIDSLERLYVKKAS